MSESPIKVLKAIVQDERLNSERMKRNLSETKFTVKDKTHSLNSKKFSFKSYIKTQISKENGTFENLSKKENKNDEPNYVQQLIDLKTYISKTNFLNQYKQKYHASQGNQNNCQITAKTQEIFNALSTTQSIDNINKKINLKQDQLNQKSNQHQHQQKQIEKEDNRQKSQFISNQSYQQKSTSDLSLIKNLQSQPYNISSHQIINKFCLVEDTLISKGSNSDRQFQSQRAQQQPEIKIEKLQSESQKEEGFNQKQSENENTIKKLINKRQIIITQNTIEDIDDGQSSGEEFDLSIIPKSRLIFKIDKNPTPQFNHQSVPRYSRQSLDINYLSQKNKPISTEGDELLQTQLLNTKKSTESTETISHKLKQIVAKRKFASENIQTQQIKNLRKLMPQIYEKADKRQKSKNRVNQLINQPQINLLNRKVDLIEEKKTFNSQASLNQFPISSEETDIDLNEAIKNTHQRTFKNRSSTTSIQNHFTKNDQNKEKESEKLRIIVKGIQRPSKIEKQIRSQSVNNNFGSQSNSILKSESQNLYPMINVLLCSNRNTDSSSRYKDLNALLSSLSQQERQPTSASLNNLSNHYSNQNSDQASPLSISNQEIPECSKSLSKDNSAEERENEKKQTLKFSQINQLLHSDSKSNKKGQFINYHILLKKNQLKKIQNYSISQNSYRSKSSLKQKYNSNPTNIQNNQNTTNQTTQFEYQQHSYPIKVQTLLHASTTSTSSSQQHHQQLQTNTLLKTQIKNLKQLNATSILDKTNKQNITTTG